MTNPAPATSGVPAPECADSSRDRGGEGGSWRRGITPAKTPRGRTMASSETPINMSTTRSIVLVRLGNRNREVSIPFGGTSRELELAVCATFGDAKSLTDSCQLILQLTDFLKMWICVCFAYRSLVKNCVRASLHVWRQISVKITLPSVYLEGIIGVWLC